MYIHKVLVYFLALGGLLSYFVAPILTSQVLAQEERVQEEAEETPEYLIDLLERSKQEHPIERELPTLNEAYVDGELIIRFHPWVPDILREDILEGIGVSDVSQYGNENYAMRVTLDMKKLSGLKGGKVSHLLKEDGHNVTITRSINTLQYAMEVLLENQAVEYVHPNYIAHAFSMVPNDSYYGLQWNLPLIGVEDAWVESRGNGTIVAVVDTGIAYENRGKYERADDLSDTGFVTGYNFIDKQGYANDDNGHGTHVAGIIASSTGNSMGVAGIAYEAEIMPIKVLDKSGMGTYADISDGIRFAVDNGAHIINVSLGGPVGAQVLEDTLVYARDKGVLVIAATGNDGNSLVSYPAAYDDYVVAVGAVRLDKEMSRYSNYGSSVDIVAPGGDTSVDQNNDGYVDGILQQTLKQGSTGSDITRFNYYFYQGTSMAAPHVAGVVALVRSLGVTNIEDIKEIIYKSAEDLGAPGWDEKTGHGMVRADRAVQLALQKIKKLQASLSDHESSDLDVHGTDTESNILQAESPIESSEEEKKETKQIEPKDDLQTLLTADTYNMFGRKDSLFNFWENAFLEVKVENNENVLSGADIQVEVLGDDGLVVARGSGKTDSSGEILLKVGTLAKGSYEAVVEAVLTGYKVLPTRVAFKFR